MNDVHIVLVDNGDTEPEVWAFRHSEDAEAFAEARGNGSRVITAAVLNNSEAKQAIRGEWEF